MSSLHLTLTVLRHHRSAGSPRRWALVGVSAGMSAIPWFLPSLAALAAGLIVHGLWIVASEFFGLGVERGC